MLSDVYFNFEREVMTNAADNAQIELTDAQRKQVEINTLLSLATHLDNETMMQQICDQLDLDYDDIKGKLPDPEDDLYQQQNAILNSTPIEGDVIE